MAKEFVKTFGDNIKQVKKELGVVAVDTKDQAEFALEGKKKQIAHDFYPESASKLTPEQIRRAEYTGLIIGALVLFIIFCYFAYGIAHGMSLI